jgi:hypothetical protein
MNREKIKDIEKDFNEFLEGIGTFKDFYAIHIFRDKEVNFQGYYTADLSKNLQSKISVSEVDENGYLIFKVVEEGLAVTFILT